MYGAKPDYDVSKATNQFLINLHQDWLLAKQVHGGTERTNNMIKAIEEEMQCRNIKPERYEWIHPRSWESAQLKK